MCVLAQCSAENIKRAAHISPLLDLLIRMKRVLFIHQLFALLVCLLGIMRRRKAGQREFLFTEKKNEKKKNLHTTQEIWQTNLLEYNVKYKKNVRCKKRRWLAGQQRLAARQSENNKSQQTRRSKKKSSKMWRSGEWLIVAPLIYWADLLTANVFTCNVIV